MPKLNRDDWLDQALKLDWIFSTCAKRRFSRRVSGRPWLPGAAWLRLGRALKHDLCRLRREPDEKDGAGQAVRGALGPLMGLRGGAAAPGSAG